MASKAGTHRRQHGSSPCDVVPRGGTCNAPAGVHRRFHDGAHELSQIQASHAQPRRRFVRARDDDPPHRDCRGRYRGVGQGNPGQASRRAFHFAHLDSGSLYRLTALRILRAHGDLRDEVAAVASARAVVPADAGRYDLRGREIAEGASVVAAIPGVRAELLGVAAAFCARSGCCGRGNRRTRHRYGRLPRCHRQALRRCSPELRARRRRLELEAAGEPASEAAILAEIGARDARDRNRAVAPLLRAPDAALLDTSDLDIDARIRGSPRPGPTQDRGSARSPPEGLRRPGGLACGRLAKHSQSFHARVREANGCRVCCAGRRADPARRNPLSRRTHHGTSCRRIDFHPSRDDFAAMLEASFGNPLACRGRGRSRASSSPSRTISPLSMWD